LLSGLTSIWSSSEAKAIEAAGLLAAGFGLPVQVDERLGENDRSATGFLPPAEFERVADSFFANPHESVRGWERAVDAQERVVRAVFRILGTHRDGDIAFIAHGGVGTLLLCKLLDAHICAQSGPTVPRTLLRFRTAGLQDHPRVAADCRGLIFNFALATL
jgi:broad specificity phosphatase PhoE